MAGKLREGWRDERGQTGQETGQARHWQPTDNTHIDTRHSGPDPDSRGRWRTAHGLAGQPTMEKTKRRLTRAKGGAVPSHTDGPQSCNELAQSQHLGCQQESPMSGPAEVSSCLPEGRELQCQGTSA